tara:strand:- start:96 stop:275 length:180 start_codon:yes stop_codon:yes gene_type:complete
MQETREGQIKVYGNSWKNGEKGKRPSSVMAVVHVNNKASGGFVPSVTTWICVRSVTEDI